MIIISSYIWLAFNAGIIALLCLDAWVLNPKGRPMTLRRALGMAGFWLILALIFNLVIYFWLGDQRALEFLTSYVVEQSLSIDNLFIFLLVFTFFKVPPTQQHKILFWGIISAQILRAVFIIGGLTLIHHFHWMIYALGLLLLLTGIKLFFEKNKTIYPHQHPLLKVIGKHLPLFWLVLMVIEAMDIIFALDSIPAVLAITKHPFVAYSSNIFAILGLRAMYFALASFMKIFHYLHYGLAAILFFVGLKMMMEGILNIPVGMSLGIILLILIVTVIFSIVRPPKAQ